MMPIEVDVLLCDAVCEACGAKMRRASTVYMHRVEGKGYFLVRCSECTDAELQRRFAAAVAEGK